MTSTKNSNETATGDKPKAQRGRPARLSRQHIIEAGLELIKQSGIETLTMRTLADALDVAPMSLYSHVKDKDDLMVGVAQMVFQRLTFNIDETASWDNQLITWMKDFRRQLHEFPQLPHLYTYNERYPASLLNTTLVSIDILKKSALLDNASLVMTARSLMWFVLGFATLESFVKPRMVQTSLELLFEQLTSLPETQRTVLEPLKPFFMERDVDEIFEFSARMMIAGITLQNSVSSAKSS